MAKNEDFFKNNLDKISGEVNEIIYSSLSREKDSFNILTPLKRV